MAVAPNDAAAAASTQADAHLREAAFLRSFAKSFTNIKSDSARDELEGHLVSYLARVGVQVSRKESSMSLAQKLHRRYLDLEREAPAALSAATPTTTMPTSSTMTAKATPAPSAVAPSNSSTPSSLPQKRAPDAQQSSEPAPAKKKRGGAAPLNKCPCCSKDHLKGAARGMDEYIKCLAAHKQTFCPCCSKPVADSGLLAHRIVCTTRLLAKRVEEGPLTATIAVKYPDPLGERSEYVCVFDTCAEGSATNKKLPVKMRSLGHWTEYDTGRWHLASHLYDLLGAKKLSCPVYACSTTFTDVIAALGHLAEVHEMEVLVDKKGIRIAASRTKAALENVKSIEQLKLGVKPAEVYVMPRQTDYKAINAKRKADKKAADAVSEGDGDDEGDDDGAS